MFRKLNGTKIAMGRIQELVPGTIGGEAFVEVLEYPVGYTQVLGFVLSNREIASKLMDSIVAGNAKALPSDVDDDGNPLWASRFEYLEDEEED